MWRITAIAGNTLREALRDRVLQAMLACCSALLLFFLALAELSLHEQRRVLIDLGLATISLLTVLLTLFVSATLLHKELERKTLYILLPKAVRRAEVVAGKFVGVVLLLSVWVALVGSLLLSLSAVQAGGAWVWPLLGVGLTTGALAALRWRHVDPTLWLPPAAWGLSAGLYLWAAQHVPPAPALAAALGLILAEGLLLCAVVLVFASFSTPLVTGLLGFGLWLVGRSADTLAATRSKLLGPGLRQFLHRLAEVCPNFNLFFPGRGRLESEVLAGGALWRYCAQSWAYALLYAAFALAIAMALFQRRDLP
ncbi:MAG: hypothetical protein ACPGUV_10385 [Polyangiales bacterium]